MIKLVIQISISDQQQEYTGNFSCWTAKPRVKTYQREPSVYGFSGGYYMRTWMGTVCNGMAYGVHDGSAYDDPDL